MKRRIAIAFAIIGMISTTAFCRPADFSAPQRALGDADPKGYIWFWREVEEIDLGEEFALPLRYGFTTRRDKGGMLGEGFVCPLLEAKAVRVSERMMCATLPCGKDLYLRKDAKEANKFQSLDKEWVAMLNGDAIQVSRDDGWLLTYQKGRLISMRTDEERTFEWLYEGKNPWATELREGNKTIVKVEDNILEPAPHFIKVMEKTYQLEFGNRPRINVIAGQTVVEGFKRTLQSWQLPDGKKESFEFGMTDERVPTLAFRDRENKENFYTWNAGTGAIKSAGDWTYEVGKVDTSSALPSIARTNSKGQKEEKSADTKLGVSSKTDINGIKRVTYRYTTPGPLYWKVKKVEEIGSEGAKRLIYKVAYDEAGRIIQQTSATGFTKKFIFDKTGKLIGKSVVPPTDNKLLEALRAKEVALLKTLEVAENDSSDSKSTEVAQRNLGLFYLKEMYCPQKAIAVATQMKNSLASFNLKMHSILSDESLTEDQKLPRLENLLVEYPEQKQIMERILIPRRAAMQHQQTKQI